MRRHFCAFLTVACALSFATSATARAKYQPKRHVKRINLDVVDAEVRDVLRLFSDVANLNFVIGDEVRGKITMRLKNVRWDRALSALLRTKGLQMHKDGNIIRVARSTVFARERKARLAASKDCLNHGKLYTRFVRLNYARADKIAPITRANLKSSRGSVMVDSRTNTLIIRDVRCPTRAP